MDYLVAHQNRKGTFLRSRLLTPRLAEVDHEHRKVQHDIPIQLGYTILQGGKLRMLQFYYDCLDYFLDLDDWQLVEVDTDSQYLALSEPIDPERMDKDLSYHPLMSMVNSDLLEEFKKMLYGHCEDNWEPDDYVHFFHANVVRRIINLTRRDQACLKLKCGALRSPVPAARPTV